MLTVLFIILHDKDKLPAVLDTWREIGVPGATIIPSVGGYQAANALSRGGLGNFFSIFSDSMNQRTIISIIDDKDLLEQAVSEADRVVGGFDSPHSGILFTLPLEKALGLQKWHGTLSKSSEQSQPVKDKGEENLLKWLEESIREVRGDHQLEQNQKLSGIIVQDILDPNSNRPVTVSVDLSITEIVKASQKAEHLPMVCVTNNEKRLVGVIPMGKLADYYLSFIFPQAFIKNPDTFEKATQIITESDGFIAGNIMEDPVFALMENSLEEAFIKMREKKLPYLPVVDKHYHVQGSISLVSILSACLD